MHLVITICATRMYSYAMHAQGRRIVACITSDPARWTRGTVILSTDKSVELAELGAFYATILPEGWTVEQTTFNHKDNLPNYEAEVQRLIARMRSAAFDVARKLKADLCWSLDSDVLPAENSLRCMCDVLGWDNGKAYQIAACPYVSQGGGAYMGGRGTAQRPILPDVYDDEKIVPMALWRRRRRFQLLIKREAEVWERERLAWEKHRKTFENGSRAEKKDAYRQALELYPMMKEAEALDESFGQCQPRGDVFFRNSNSGIDPFHQAVRAVLSRVLKRQPKLLSLLLKLLDREAAQYRSNGFKRRGWVDAAYAGLGWGTVVPTDWHGFGCCVMTGRALALAQFDGYEGGGTEDLYVVWKRWARAELRIGLVLHAPCDHVVRIKNAATGEVRYELHQAYFERDNPECVGHLRTERRPWVQAINGEQ